MTQTHNPSTSDSRLFPFGGRRRAVSGDEESFCGGFCVCLLEKISRVKAGRRKGVRGGKRLCGKSCDKSWGRKRSDRGREALLREGVVQGWRQGMLPSEQLTSVKVGVHHKRWRSASAHLVCPRSTLDVHSLPFPLIEGELEVGQSIIQTFQHARPKFPSDIGIASPLPPSNPLIPPLVVLRLSTSLATPLFVVLYSPASLFRTRQCGNAIWLIKRKH